MAIVFSDNFDSGSLTGWGSPNTLATVNLWGYGHTYCVGCNEPNLSSRKTFASTQGSQGAIRAQVACILTTTDATDGGLVFNVQDFHGGVGTNNFQLLVYLRPDGSFRIRWNNNGTPTYINSLGSLFPVDGTQFGLQIRFQIASVGDNTVTFTVNNVDVSTLTWTHVARANVWDDIWLYGFALPTTGTRPPYTSLVLVDNYEADTSMAAVTNWPAGTAPQLDLAVTCIGAPPDPPATTVYEVRCERVFLLPSSPTLKKMFLKRLEFVIQTAVGLSAGQGSDPQMMVSISRDGGRSFGPEFWLSMGKIGEFRRAYKNALGSYRHGAVKVVISDPVFIALLGADATLEEGIS